MASPGEERIMGLGLDDMVAITQRVATMLHGIDGRRWAEVGSCFTDRVETDYTSLFGGEVMVQAAQELVTSWEKLLSPLAAAQHLLGPVAVFGDATKARAACHVRARLSPPPESEIRTAMDGCWALRHGAREAGRVLANRKAQALDSYYQTGNGKLLSET